MILLLALVNGGCSFSYQLGSLFEKGGDEASTAAASAEQTSSISTDTKTTAKTVPNPSEGDLAYARAAASEVLARGKKESSQPWENPNTGARGTVTPIAQAYDQDGFTCQDFLASYVREGKGEAWLQGEACRLHKGQWEVRSMKPWKSS